MGVNAIVPARAGDIVKMFLIVRSNPRARYATLTGTLVAETLFDFAVAGGLLVWVLLAGVLPGVRFPDLPAFELSAAVRHPWYALLIVAGLVLGGCVLARAARHFWRQFGQGLGDRAQPGRDLRSATTRPPGLGLLGGRRVRLPGGLRGSREPAERAHRAGGGEPRQPAARDAGGSARSRPSSW